MAFCTNCGEQLVEGAKFCASCGQAVNGSISMAQRKTVYDGKIHKCPNCGDTIDAYETVCETCGFEIRGRQITSVVHDLALKLENVNDVQKKDELIRTFYIPNTREDIYEFFILAISNIKAGGTHTKAWMAKLEQAYQKAELSFSGSQESERLKTLYVKAQAIERKTKALQSMKGICKCFKSGYTWAMLFGAVGAIFLLINIGLEELTLYIIGGILIYVAIMVAIFTAGGINKNKQS